MHERIVTIEVVKSKNRTRLQLREFDGIFTYQLPLMEGETDRLREAARLAYLNSKSLVYGEIDLEKLKELGREARKRHPNFSKIKK